MGAGEHGLQARNTANEFFPSRQIKLAHDVVENKDGVFPRKTLEGFHFRQLDGQRRRTGLPLRGVRFGVNPRNENVKAVTVRPYRRKAKP